MGSRSSTSEDIDQEAFDLMVSGRLNSTLHFVGCDVEKNSESYLQCWNASAVEYYDPYCFAQYINDLAGFFIFLFFSAKCTCYSKIYRLAEFWIACSIGKSFYVYILHTALTAVIRFQSFWILWQRWRKRKKSTGHHVL